MADENPIESCRLWRVQRPSQRGEANTPWFCSDMELFELADKEANQQGNRSFRGNTPQAAKAYLKRLGFFVEAI